MGNDLECLCRDEEFGIITFNLTINLSRKHNCRTLGQLQELSFTIVDDVPDNTGIGSRVGNQMYTIWPWFYVVRFGYDLQLTCF